MFILSPSPSRRSARSITLILLPQEPRFWKAEGILISWTVVSHLSGMWLPCRSRVSGRLNFRARGGGTEEKASTPLRTLAWKIPWTEEPGRLQSIGSLRVGHDWATSLSLFTFMHWRRKWQPTAVFLPGESQGRRSLVGCRLWGRTELDTTAAAAAGRNGTSKQREAILCFSSRWHHNLTFWCLRGRGRLLWVCKPGI